MRKFHLPLKGMALLLFFVCLTALGQSQTVTGSVKDADKKTPLGGVTIKVVGASAVTQTDDKGNFTVKATTGQTLLISSVGYEAQKVVVQADKPITVSLKSQSTELEEVTVAMDIKRNPKELGYSAQKVGGDDVKETQRENFLNGLQGRVAGATITSTSGVPGASSAIVLRGFNSMSLNNQPLFVVDGVILDNSTIDATANIAGAAGQSNTSNDFTNRIADLNPNDIETYTVLKGPEATVLYGSAASNGAIVITTKKAKITADNKLKVSYDNSFRLQSLQNMPAMFNGFQQGLNGVASSTFSAFGPKMDPTSKLYDNVGNFFKTSFGQTQNVSVEFGSPKSSNRFSGSYYDQSGVVPNTRLTKSTFRLTNTTKIGKYIDITPSLTYTRSDNDKALKGAGGYLLNLFLWPSTDDAEVYLLKNGHKRFLLLANNDVSGAPLSGSSEIDNPFFDVNRNVSKDKTDNYGANLAININPTKWLSIAGRFGYNYYTTTGFQFRDPESASQSSLSNKGQLDNYWTKQANYNHTITASAKKSIGKFNARLTVGTRWSSSERQLYGISGTQDSTRSYDSSSTGIATRSRLSRAALVGPTEWNLYNSMQIAGFGEGQISYNNVIFLTGSLAFESSSVLPKANRNYSYPGGSLSIIMSDIFPSLKKNILNYWKLRASLASTARLPDPYSNQSNFVPTVTSSVLPVPVQYAFTNANPNLKPERQKTYEIGSELKLFDNKVSVDVAYYNTLATDQIAQGFRASYGTGFVLNTANNSSVRNQGIELSLSYQVMRKKDFDWNIQFNFNHMWNKVLAIPASIDVAGGDYYDASTWLYNNARGGLRRGYTTGTITSFGYRRQDLTPTGPNGLPFNDGSILINATTGLPVNDGTFRVHGDRTVWFTLGTINKFRYKNWNLSFLWDLRVGGDVFNATNMYLTSLGKSQKTADRLTPRAIKGVLQNGLENTGSPTANAIMVTPYYNYLYYSTSNMPEEDYIEHNIKAFRLRDISLSYSMPREVLNKYVRAFKSMSFFLTCNDLILFTNYSGADPSSNGGNASLRGVGAVGFDYGNIAAPLSFNAGFRIGF
ncbi:SusC/RagA family TonB-linked outer membrane protein [Parasediminibacterium paludis]|uniref:SusC/RagA family TonB-linked outer membrane protein n=1 Tax=Parasediminibacterium paludis TaxID=908966 RepID=A0ABV8PSR0_9BACT